MINGLLPADQPPHSRRGEDHAASCGLPVPRSTLARVGRYPTSHQGTTPHSLTDPGTVILPPTGDAELRSTTHAQASATQPQTIEDLAVDANDIDGCFRL